MKFRKIWLKHVGSAGGTGKKNSKCGCIDRIRRILRKFGLTIPESFSDEIHSPWGRTTRSRVEPIYWQRRLNPCPIWMICARVKDAERSAQFLAQAADLRPLQVAFSDGGGGWENLDAG
jgi:hypothetical protein